MDGIKHMSIVIDIIDHYKVLQDSTGYIVVNMLGEYENHGHFKKLATCYVIIRLIRKQQMPKKDYMIEAARRITADWGYRNKLVAKQEKNLQRQYYFNPNKGVQCDK